MASRRKRASAGRNQGLNKSAGRWKNEQRHKRGVDDARAEIHTIAAQRRPHVFGQPTEYTGTEGGWTPIPKKGTPERAALVAEVVRLREQGMTHLAISETLNISSVSHLLREHDATIACGGGGADKTGASHG